MGSKIKELRKKRGWTQEKLAEESGLNRVTIALIETGRSKQVMSDTIAAIAHALGVTVDELFSAQSVNSD